MKPRPFRIAALAGAALALVTACASETETATPTAAPTEPTRAISAAPAPNVAAALGNKIASTCRGYAKRRAALQAAIGKAQGDETTLASLREQLATLEAIKKDACD